MRVRGLSVKHLRAAAPTAIDEQQGILGVFWELGGLPRALSRASFGGDAAASSGARERDADRAGPCLRARSS
jgi:hypothetical protein